VTAPAHLAQRHIALDAISSARTAQFRFEAAALGAVCLIGAGEAADDGAQDQDGECQE
jgi:hypothetical protein